MRNVIFVICAVICIIGVSFAQTIPIPAGQQSLSYPPIVSPEKDPDPSKAKPVAVGSIAGGGDTVRLQIGIDRFSGPVDVYVGAFSPAIDPVNIHLLRPDNSFQPISAGLVPWKRNSTEIIDETIFGNTLSSAFPSGTSYLWLLVTPAGESDFSAFYLWATSFVISGQETGEWTDESFPPYIRRLTRFGERADWSHDGQRVLFVEKTFGDVYEFDITTGIIRAMTHHYFHEGYTRALYLSNGDILLSGSRTFSSENPLDARVRTAELWVLSKALDRPPVALGEFCAEGPAVSRRNLRIAWTVNYLNLPDLLPAGVWQIWLADIDYLGPQPRLVNKRLMLDNRNLPFDALLETQNFVPPDEKELTFTAGGFQGTEVMGLNLETGVIVNYSQAPDEYDEPEGVFPDGRSTLVESDRHSRKGPDQIDLYRLALDGSGRMERITFFNEGGRFKASNPVVSDDGRFMAFQAPPVGLMPGTGRGIYLLDLQAAGLR